MQDLPHQYSARASGGPDGEIPVKTPGVPPLTTTAPPEFDGPEGYWSPESMLTATVANCFILTFRAIARKAGFGWSELDVSVEGLLEKTPEGLAFTRFYIKVTLVSDEPDTANAEQLLHKAEKHCLVTASLKAKVELSAKILAGC